MKICNLVKNEPENIYTLCDVNADGKIICSVANYSDENEQTKDIKIDFGRRGKYEIYLLDETHDSELIDTTDKLEFSIEPNTCLYIKEI